MNDWRQSAYNLRCLKKAYRRAQQLKRSAAQDAEKRAARQEAIRAAHAEYLNLAERQIDQVRRRVLKGETIPHHEKVFSLFAPHTEWISQGKAGVPVELGLRVAISEDPFGFLLNHRVMQKETDDQAAVPLVADLAERHDDVISVSLDKGFHSPANQHRLAEIIDFPVLPKKGKRPASALEREHSARFQRLRRRHSAVESAINALEAHGLDRCPDHGLDGFKRYVALAVVARNLHRLGAILLAQD